MEANKSPEKLYLFEGEPILSARSKKVEGAYIEYTRADAFIEKVCEFLSNEANIPLWEDYNTFGCDTTKLIENFKNYMKGG